MSGESVGKANLQDSLYPDRFKGNENRSDFGLGLSEKELFFC